MSVATGLLIPPAPRSILKCLCHSSLSAFDRGGGWFPGFCFYKQAVFQLAASRCARACAHLQDKSPEVWEGWINVHLKCLRDIVQLPIASLNCSSSAGPSAFGRNATAVFTLFPGQGGQGGQGGSPELEVRLSPLTLQTF